MKPTAQQARIIEEATSGKSLKVAALAGTGKTTTLGLLAQALPQKRILYLAFNRAIAQEAQGRMPHNVSSRTAHSLAMAAAGAPYRNRLLKSPFAAAPKLEPILQRHMSRMALMGGISPRQAYAVIMEAFARFLHTTAPTMRTRLLPAHIALMGDGRSDWAELVTEAVNLLWTQMTRPGSTLPVTHDVYLKAWYLQKEPLPFDLVLLDEAQDADPIILSAVLEHQGQKVLVGDGHQAIYSWRGAVNAMENAELPELPLTQSWRFGPQIADHANRILRLLPGDLSLEGLAGPGSVIASDGDPRADAVLSRSNGALVVEALERMDREERVCIVGGTRDVSAYLRAAHALWMGNRTTHAEFAMFRNWDELEDTSQEPIGSSYKPIVSLVNRYRAQVPAIADRLEREVLQDEREADVVLSTGHKAKGREWGRVRLLDDFPPLFEITNNRFVFHTEEANLLYVVSTRAKTVLNTGSAVKKLLGSAEKSLSSSPGQAAAAEG